MFYETVEFIGIVISRIYACYPYEKFLYRRECNLEQSFFLIREGFQVRRGHLLIKSPRTKQVKA